MATDFYTAAELANLTNAVLDFYMKGDALAQTLQDRPTLEAFRAKQSTFPGGKDLIRGNIKGDYTTAFQGFSYDDNVEYKNPANLKQFSWRWFELHAGISMTFTELKAMGITVVDSLSGEKTAPKSQASIMQITDGLKDKLDDMMEGSMRSMNSILWRDGTASAKVFPGISAIIRDDPTVGVVGGIDAAANTWWRNRSKVGSNKITSSTSGQTLTKTLRAEVRQLRRFGGRPAVLMAGTGFIEKLEAEIHEKGVYTQEGFSSNKATDITMSDISMRGVGKIQYDPTLDDEGRSNFLYMIDPRNLMLKVMEGEDMKTHAPARPAEKYVLYRAVTWTGALIANKLNSHGVYEAA